MRRKEGTYFPVIGVKTELNDTGLSSESWIGSLDICPDLCFAIEMINLHDIKNVSKNCLP